MALAAGLTATGCFRSGGLGGQRTPDSISVEPPIRGGAIVLAVSTPPQQLDPHRSMAGMTQRLAAFCFSRLFKGRSGPSMGAGPPEYMEDLASASESAPDALTHVVQLKAEARFGPHPALLGRRVTAHDVVLSFERYRTGAGRKSGQLASVDRMQAVDETTVRFDLQRPMAAFLETLASPVGLWILPVPEIESGNLDPDLVSDFAGSGPFRLEAVGAERILLRRNERYIVAGVPYLDAITIAVEGEYARSKVQFRDGSIDVLRPFAIDVPDLRQATPEAGFYGDIPLGMNYLSFGLNEGPGRHFADVRVRRAVSLAIERSVLIETYANVSQIQNLGLQAEGRFHNAGVPAGLHRWWLDPTGAEMGKARRWYIYDPKEARALLLAAGIQPGTEIPLRFTRSPQGEATTSMAQMFALMLSEAGLQVRLHAVDAISNEEHQGSAGRSDGIALGSATPHTSVDDWLTAMLHSAGPNGGRLPVDSRLDRLIEKAQASSSMVERKSLIHEVQRYASDRMYFVPTVAGSAWTAVRPRVRNFPAYRTNSGNYGQGAEQWPWVHVGD